MSKETQSGSGLFSKVVKFVRHPATHWGALDGLTGDPDGGSSAYSKQALKEMIERKRRNDFVRKREFEMLRKLRNQHGAQEQVGYGGRPSFFQSGLSSKPDNRAGTLRKIDEIEAQMSMQWWKGKQKDIRPEADSQRSVPDAIDTIRGYRTTLLSDDVSNTVSPPPAVDFPLAAKTAAPTQSVADATTQATNTEVSPVGSGMAAPPTLELVFDEPPVSSLPADPVSGFKASAFSPSKFYALDVQELAMDPEIEEAAIRFASGDETAAEQGLLDVLYRKDGQSTRDEWLALFDLYRALGKLEPFEQHALDYAARFSRSAPQWVSLPDVVAARTKVVQGPDGEKQRATWVAEPEVDIHLVNMLAKVLDRVPQPWTLDWSSVQTIDPDAQEPLLKLFNAWASSDVHLKFKGVRNLRIALQEVAPSGDKTISRVPWDLHLAALRVLNLIDDFELAALDFCVTYEMSPPSWESPKCVVQDLDGGTSSALAYVVDGDSVLSSDFGPGVRRDARDSTLTGSSYAGLSPMVAEFMGELLGDPQAVLVQADQILGDSPVRSVSCRHLIRVDFSAAGAILNWASAQHAQGREIRFIDVHRLVAAFFHVIGITEYAKVMSRDD